MKHTITAVAVALVGVAALSGCSATSSGPDAFTSSTSQSASMVGADPGTWSPIEITPSMNGQTIDMKLGQHAVFSGLPADDADNRIVIQSSNPLAIEPTQQGMVDGVTSVAGLTAVGMGASHILVFDGNTDNNGGEVINQYVVQVFDSKEADDAPGNESPAVLQPGSSRVTLEPGASGVIDGLPTGAYTVASDNEMVALPMATSSTQADPGFLTVGDGTANVTVTDASGAIVATVAITGHTEGAAAVN